ncbi:pyrroline-5-carboxylate reductase [Mortierella sp. GBAus27b]|nr:pyrroline-5-carboxylate reductase [Mortierella sp. GBAus27b]
MAEAMLGGLLACGYPLSQCVVSEPIQARCEFLQTKYPGLQTLSGPDANRTAFQPAEVVVLAVKPQVLRSVVVDLAPALESHQPLLISIAAGIETSAIEFQSKDLPPVIRVMPNTPALVLEGAAGLYATPEATADHRRVAESLLGAVSKQLSWVESESLIDTVTGISGSGPAYFFLMMEAMEEAGVALGMDRETAKALTIQTCLGAAKMAQLSDDDLKTLRVKVTSPQGTTDAAIKAFEAGGFRELVQKGVTAADARSRTLAKELGGSKL